MSPAKRPPHRLPLISQCRVSWEPLDPSAIQQRFRPCATRTDLCCTYQRDRRRAGTLRTHRGPDMVLIGPPGYCKSYLVFLLASRSASHASCS